MKAAKEIKALRKRLGLTQRALADRIGATVTTVARWESGAFAPSWEYAERIRNLEKKLRGAA